MSAKTTLISMYELELLAEPYEDRDAISTENKHLQASGLVIISTKETLVTFMPSLNGRKTQRKQHVHYLYLDVDTTHLLLKYRYTTINATELVYKRLRVKGNNNLNLKDHQKWDANTMPT